MKVEQIISKTSNRAVPNQFLIKNAKYRGVVGSFFQSYNSMIAFRPASGATVILDRDKWDYSRTTSRYRNQFLNETTKETKAKIKAGFYILADLNAE